MTTVTCTIREIDEFGAAVPDVTPAELAEQGFELGDTVDFYFSNGTTLEQVPYYNGYYADAGYPVFVAYPGFAYPAINISGGCFAVRSGICWRYLRKFPSPALPFPRI